MSNRPRLSVNRISSVVLLISSCCPDIPMDAASSALYARSDRHSLRVMFEDWHAIHTLLMLYAERIDSAD